MTAGPELLLVGAVAAVGVLHTIVPDHWLPISLIARQRNWSKRETAVAALRAGIGHALSTLAIGVAVWLAGVAAAERFGHLVDIASSLALIGFGCWIALSASQELRGSHAHGHSHDEVGHGYAHRHADDDGRVHVHRFAFAKPPPDDPLYVPLRGGAAVLTRHVHAHHHGRRRVHAHWHDHLAETDHAVLAGALPRHDHRHKTTGRTSLVLILGSSPMVEGVPAFFAAAKYGPVLLGIMALAFAAATISTYVLLCVYSSAGLQQVRFGAVERYGEVLSGASIALVGLAFWAWPIL